MGVKPLFGPYRMFPLSVAAAAQKHLVYGKETNKSGRQRSLYLLLTQRLAKTVWRITSDCGSSVQQPTQQARVWCLDRRDTGGCLVGVMEQLGREAAVSLRELPRRYFCRAPSKQCSSHSGLF